jgi:hypothetical protein
MHRLVQLINTPLFLGAPFILLETYPDKRSCLHSLLTQSPLASSKKSTSSYKMYEKSHILYELKFGNPCTSVSILLCLQQAPVEDTGNRKPDIEQSKKKLKV